jgi:hypothetical protein
MSSKSKSRPVREPVPDIGGLTADSKLTRKKPLKERTRSTARRGLRMNKGWRQPPAFRFPGAPPKFKRGGHEDSRRDMFAMPFEGHEKLAALARPDKAEAVLLLRQIGYDPRRILATTREMIKNLYGVKITDRELLLQHAKILALTFRYIADCIEGTKIHGKTMRWHRGPELTLFEEGFLHHATGMVLFKPHGVLRKVALSDAVNWLAGAWGCETEQGRRKVRETIERQLKIAARVKREFSGK